MRDAGMNKEMERFDRLNDEKNKYQVYEELYPWIMERVKEYQL